MDDNPADRARHERQLDNALKETFPASDPIAIRLIGATPGTMVSALASAMARQRLTRRRLRSLIDRHGQTAHP